MAFASDSTTAPEPHRALLSIAADAATAGACASVARSVGDAFAAVVTRVARQAPARDACGRFAKAPLPSADDLLAEIAAEIERQSGKPELPPEPLLPADLPRGVASDRPEAFGSVPNQPAQIRSVDRIGISDVVPSYPDAVGVVADLGAAHTIHLRRQLEAAAEHGVALLASLGLPQLVGPDMIVIDPVAAGDALDLAIATLDALDAPNEDREPHDVEDASILEIWGEGDFHEDAEDDDPAEGTSLETHGRAFVRAGEDDAEDVCDAEPSLGARNPTWGSLGDSVSQIGWGMDSDDMDRETDHSDAEPYLSVVEFDGRGDNWSRTGQPTMGRHWTDVEAVNEDGGDEHHDSSFLVWVFGPSRREVANV